MDDYFSSAAGGLSYTVSGNTHIQVSIAPDTHLVSFSQSQAWFGTEKIRFTVLDTDNNSTLSNEITLQVEGVDNPPVLDYIPDISVDEAAVVTITPHAVDLDDDTITYSFTAPIGSDGKWQTNYNSAGAYTITVTAADTTNLTDTQEVIVNVRNVNRAPVIELIPEITANEGELVVITPVVSDADNDAISVYYSVPLDTTGKWLTDYDDAGTYNIQVTASDGIDTVSRMAKVIINNTNRAPQVSLSLSKYTVSPNEAITITLSASDPDGGAIAFILKKDGADFASGSFDAINPQTGTPANPLTFILSFAALGDHTITVVVTDAGGLSASVTKGIDCADPNANRDAINPVIGDFNGDSLCDLGLHNSETGTWEICLSDKGVFRNAVDWLTGFGTSKDWWPIGGDFNGDGKTDIGIYNNTTGELKVAISSGSGFSVLGTWLSFSSASYSWQPFSGNFNGDKYTDVAFYNKDTGEASAALGTGSGFGVLSIWNNNFGTDYIAMSGDFNADSLSDLCLFKKSTGEFKIAFSNTKGFVDGSSWISGFAADKDALVSDFNNDGLTDIGYWDKSSSKWYYAISTGDKFIDKGIWLDGFGTGNDESATSGDFNADGITDAACFDKDQLGINRWAIKLSTNKPADLLTEIDNGIGGKTRVSYTYAASGDNPELPFPVYTASAISLIASFPADRAVSYTQNFTFSGGYYDAGEREFRGFAKVKVSDPITNNYTETYFYQGRPGQDGALKGQIEKLIAYDGNSRQISQTLNTYEVRKAGPQERFLGFPALIETSSTVWEENGTSLSTKDRFSYDNIGNVIEQKNEGDVLKTGDEKSTAISYAQAYYAGFNRPLETALKDKDANIVSRKTFEYDSKGNLIKEIAHILNPQTGQPANPLTGTPANPQTQYAYDSFGNLTTTTNALGNTVTTDYKTDSYTYPEKVTNTLGQSVTYIYDPRFGVIKSTTDANGLISESIYDSLGRLTGKQVYPQTGSPANPLTFTTYTYPDFNTKITTNAIGLSATEYIDGLGRKYKTVSQGEDGDSARQVVSEVFYNNRGLTEKESLVHYIVEDVNQISYIQYEYDIRGRIKETISDFPGTSADAESSVNYISPLYGETTDPLGHRTGTLKDIYGNIIEVTEFTSDGVFKTKYEYDTQNNLIKTTDNQGNIAQIFYDSLGRKTKMIDPDMGTWSYEYDLAGNLVKQTDAKGQVLGFEYDQLNRLVKKTAGVVGDGPARPVIYIYDDSSKENCVGRLSKVQDQSGSSEFFYDKLGREIKSIKTINTSEVAAGLLGGGIGYTAYAVQREYDILDRLTKLTYPDGEVVQYVYDIHSGLLEKVFSTLSSSLLIPRYYVEDITYNAKGQIKTIKYGNGVSTDYTYGQDLRLSRILTTNFRTGQALSLQDLNYNFDHNGNVHTLTDNLRSNIRSFSYDDLDRLTRAENVPAPGGGYTNFDYQYDSIGNMTYKSDTGVMSYGESVSGSASERVRPHALTSAGGYTYKYDANGNMIIGKNKTLAYDIENRLISVDNGQQIESYLYDGDGGRVRKTVSLRGSAATEAISTTYIGSLYEIEMSQSAGEPVSRLTKHIFAGANRVCSVNSQTGTPANPQTYYYHSDHLGSSNVVTDENGNQAQYCEYTPYGTLARNEPVNPKTRSPVHHYFTGKELDSTGLYFYGARYYDPEIGRFITADTIVQSPYDPQSLNRYSYCRNNPINYVDPSGHSWWKSVKNFFSKWGGLFGMTGGLINGIINNDWRMLQSQATSFATGFILGGPYAAIASVMATSFLDTPPGRQFSGFMSEDVFDDVFGMRPRAAYIVGNMVATAIVASAIYIAITPSSYAGPDYTNPANQHGEIMNYASNVESGPGGSSANWIGKQIDEGNAAIRLSKWYPQGRLSSEVAFQDTPFVGKVLNALQIRHAAAVVNVGGKLIDSAKDVSLLAPLRGQIWGAPWTGVCHQAAVRTLVQGGMSGMQAVQATASQVGWSFYLSSSIYGAEGHSGAVGIINAEVNRR
ncbi:MAG: RHS repeat-associated core domain-containing protein [Planctomycetota bacterium]